jgi:hypothetical protein
MTFSQEIIPENLTFDLKLNQYPPQLKRQTWFSSLSFFLEQKFPISPHDSTRYSLYPRPKAWDTATIGATNSRLDIHNYVCQSEFISDANLMFIEMLKQVQHDKNIRFLIVFVFMKSGDFAQQSRLLLIFSFLRTLRRAGVILDLYEIL